MGPAADQPSVAAVARLYRGDEACREGRVIHLALASSVPISRKRIYFAGTVWYRVRMITLSHVPSSYQHHVKRAEAHGTFVTGASVLKLYHIALDGQPVPDAVASEASTFLAGAIREAGCAGDRGFVVLHRCGFNFYFLLVTVWRGANEAWEAVYYSDGTMDRFALFEPAYPPSNAPLRPTFCVWELGVVAHEAKAWSRFLLSPREKADDAVGRNDTLSGDV